MDKRMKLTIAGAVPFLLALGVGTNVDAATTRTRTSTTQQTTTRDQQSGPAQSAQDRVNDAIGVIDQMKQDPQLTRVLERARGVFVVPHYGKGAFIVGGQGGGGVLLARAGERWSEPAFYSIGGGSIGAQAGGEGGSIAMLLMTDKAVRKFENSSNTWSLNANAGLTVVTWSGKSQENTGKGDVILWSNTNGLYGGLTASVTDITPDTKMDHAYYGERVSSRQILMGSVSNPSADRLRQALKMQVASR